MKKLVIITLICVLVFSLSAVLVVRNVNLPERLEPADKGEGSESIEPTEPHRLSYKDGDVQYGFIAKTGDDTEDHCLIFYTDELKPNTKYTLSWEIDYSFMSDPKHADEPWKFNVGYSEDEDRYYYFAYDTSYVSGDNQFMLLNAEEDEALCKGSSIITSESQEDIFVLWTLTLKDSTAGQAQSAFGYLEPYIIDIVFEEVVE